MNVSKFSKVVLFGLLCMLLGGFIVYISLYKKKGLFTLDNTKEIVYRTTYIDKPIVKSILVGFLDTISTPIDTLAIIEDYYSKKTYNEVIQLDRVGRIELDIELFKNEIEGIAVTPILYKPKRNTIYLGVSTLGVETLYTYDLGTKYSVYVRVGLPFNIGAGVGRKF